jgi:hypothetical protein
MTLNVYHALNSHIIRIAVAAGGQFLAWMILHLHRSHQNQFECA